MPIPQPRILVLIALVLFATACANFSAISPGTRAQEVRSTFGVPGTVWKNPDGSEVWEYPLGPLGVQTYMITIASNQTVREVRQVLSEEYLDKVQAGMPRDEIREVLLQVAVYCGMPAGVEAFRLAREAMAEQEAGKRS